MKYIVIERYKFGAIKSIYDRFDENGRMMPDGLRFLESWVADDLTMCFQLMETDEVTLIAEWKKQWQDLVEFEVIPVVTTDQARRMANEN